MQFSHTHCVAICAALVPLNVVATLVTMILTALKRPPSQVQLAAGVASLFSGIMVLHVLTWFIIGIIMPPTFVLLGLASTCLATNLWAVNSPSTMIRVLNWILGDRTPYSIPEK
ncbi:MAG: hypothetical protein VKJ46_11170 [Leptolyngbyaceae bacterium]|nr:hypothetical protein [Leptolyngbyaceae bacterium]